MDDGVRKDPVQKVNFEVVRFFSFSIGIHYPGLRRGPLG